MAQVDPGYADYRQQLAGNLTLRWSTKDDREGLALVGALAYGDAEEREDDYAVRSAERLAMDEYPTGCSTSWAICVESGNLEESNKVSTDSAYVENIRNKATAAKERVVAAILLNQHIWTFEKGAATVTAGRIGLSACKIRYRGRPGLMSGLFEMVHARSASRGDVLSCVNGIPAYYSKKGYEYAINFGKGLVSHFGDLPLASEPLPPLFSPTSPENASALDQMEGLQQFKYSLRPAEPKDADRLLELHEKPRESASQWVAYQNPELRNYTRWLSGERWPPFSNPEESHTLDLPMREPVSVLESSDSKGNMKIVAAMVLQPSRSPRQIIASRVLFDAEADLALITRELLLQTVPAVLYFWRYMQSQKEESGNSEVNGFLSSEPSSLIWFLPDNNPISIHLTGQGLASAVRQDSLFFREEWSVRIPDMLLFLKAIKFALDARLQQARAILGAAFNIELRIGCYDLRYGGVKLSIRNCTVQSISKVQWEARHLERGSESFGSGETINLLASYQTLVPLFMGYKTRRELQSSMPDLQLSPEVAVVTDVLFPKSIPSFPAYL